MKTRFRTAITLACAFALALAMQTLRPAVAHAAEHAECSHLMTLKLPDVTHAAAPKLARQTGR